MLLNFIPSSTGVVSGSEINVGAAVGFQIEQGHVDAAVDVRAIEAVFAVPFSVAVTTAVWAVVTAPATVVNVAVVAPARTVTEVGDVSSALLSYTVTMAPVEGAAVFSRTVQMPLAPDVSVVGLQVKAVGTSGASNETALLTELSFTLAVRMTVLEVVIVNALAVKVALVAPAGTVTEAGDVSNELLSISVTTVPPVGAALLSVTVQRLLAPDPSELGLQPRADGVTV